MHPQNVELGGGLCPDRRFYPHKSIYLAVNVGQAQVFFVKPCRTLALVQLFLAEPALLGVLGNRGGVDAQKLRVVVPRHEGGEFYVGALGPRHLIIAICEAAPQAQQGALGASPAGGSEGARRWQDPMAPSRNFFPR